ncbi:leucine-rich repeat domain-containing protein [Secundilactobacillus mixtipabuli]|uniref:DUF5776 domain-containing protein n=1 Tax=Secundilactobacillus mixtipabuli TaxID=1435342 RepID=A0A1Z5I962_9LACO|nr:leucine-rich repeat domain-containing protein [Secundilactobacillus mixtipabuli]GAW98208.1 hypothetical protein IWT30_00151 [Secundilactobacillus mixtipabuli]
MKKRIKLFSSVLAIGMLLGTGVGSLSAVTQQEPWTTAVAKASIKASDTRAGESVTLENNEMMVADGIITDANLSKGQKENLLDGGILIIPESYDNGSGAPVPITGVGHAVFSKDNLGGTRENEGIKKVIFENPQGIDYIGDRAFYDNEITDINLPNVETIGDYAFYNNEITDINLPNVETIGDYAFYNNEITDINLPNVETIGNSAFYKNELTNVNLPNIKTIGYAAFTENKIKRILINEGHPHNSDADIGTVENPQIQNEAFGNQFWHGEVMQFTYQPTISYQNLVKELGLVFKVNGNDYLNETRFKGSVVIEHADNIDYSDDDQQIIVTSEEGGIAYVWMDILDKSQEDSSTYYLYGLLGLAVSAKNGGIDPNPPVPGPEDNNKPDTSNPDTGDNESGNNNGNETKPQPAPKPEEKRPHTVYAKRGMRLHRNVSLTSPIRSYKKQSRAKAANFRVRGIAYDKNGKKRYKVDGGYITAGSSYVADSHFRSNKVRQVRVLSNRINSYKDVKLSSNKKVRSYKKGTKLRVKRVVNWGRATRFELTNGRYITGNKQLLIMDQK